MKTKLLLITLCLCWVAGPIWAQQSSYKLVRLFKGHSDGINVVSFSPEGNLLVSGSADHTLKIWDVREKQLLHTLAHADEVTSVAFSPEGNLLLSGSEDYSVKVWDVSSGRLLHSFEDHSASINGVAFHPSGKYVAAVAEDSWMNIWDLESKTKKNALKLDEAAVDLAFSPNGDQLITGDWNGELIVWDMRNGQKSQRITAHYGSIAAIDISPDGQWAATAGSDRKIKIWNLPSGKVVKTLDEHEGKIFDIAFSPDMQKLLSGSKEAEYIIWDLKKGVPERKIRHREAVGAVCFNPNGQLLVSGSYDYQVRVWFKPGEDEQASSQREEQTRPTNPVFSGKSDVDFNLPPFQGANDKAVAVVIGNRNYYNDDIPPVDFAIQDAGSMKKYLMEVFGYREENILYLPNATQSDFYGAFGTVGNHRAKLYSMIEEGESDVFIYYSGHGMPDTESKGGFFVPVDAEPALVAFQGYPLGTFYENVSRLPFKSLTVVLDACFSGASERGMLIQDASPVYIKPKNPVLRNPRARVFTSAANDQISSWYPAKSHSLFTYFFLKGLQGAADADQDASLTMGELKTYLDQEVPSMARRLKNRSQDPEIYGNAEGRVLKLGILDE